MTLVRVHTDRPADRAARERKAQAFTVGTHIIFARDSFRPDTAQGWRLLVHELAHVIQQTARADHRGVLRLCDGHSLGRPQHRDVLRMKAPSPDEVVEFYLGRVQGSKDEEDEIRWWRDEVAAGREPWATRDAELESIDDMRRKAAGLTGADRAKAEADIAAREEAATKGLLSLDVLAFSIDHLKALGKDAEAARLLGPFPGVGTMFLRREVLLTLAAQRKADIADVALHLWNTDPLFDESRPTRIGAFLRGYVLGPGRLIPGMKVGGKWIEEHELFGKGLTATKSPLPLSHPKGDPLLRNELHWGPVQAIYDVHRFRMGLMKELHEWVTKGSSKGKHLSATTYAWIQPRLQAWRDASKMDEPDYEPPVGDTVIKARVGDGLAVFFADPDLATIDGLRPEAARLLAAVAPGWLRAILPAVRLWRTVFSLPNPSQLRWEDKGSKLVYIDPRTGLEVEAPFTAMDVLLWIQSGDAAPFVKFRKYLAAMAKRLFVRHRGKIPAPKKYASLVEAEKTRLRDAVYRAFESRVAYLMASTEDFTAASDVYMELVALTWFLYGAVDGLRETLESYELAPDTEKGAQDRTDLKAIVSEPTLPGFTPVTPFVQRERSGDLRLVHRAAIGQWLWQTGSSLNWQDVVDAAFSLHNQDDARIKEPDLALVSDWTWDPETPLDAIKDDFPNPEQFVVTKDGTTKRGLGTIGRWDPLGMRQVYRVFKTRRHEAERAKILELVEAARQSTDVPKEPILNVTEAWVEANFVRPRRAIVGEYYLEASGKAEVLDRYPKVLLEHPKTQDFQAGATGGTASRVDVPLWVVPYRPPSSPPLVMWAIPDLTVPIEALREDAPLRDWVYEWHFVEKNKLPKFTPGADFDEDNAVAQLSLESALSLRARDVERSEYDSLGVEVWWMLLRLAIRGSTDPKSGWAEDPWQIFDDLIKNQYTTLEDRRQALIAAQREATSIERNRRVLFWIQGLEAYRSGLAGLDPHKVPRLEPGFLSDLDAAVWSALLDFEQRMVPGDDDPHLHRAAAMFELVDMDGAALTRLKQSDSHYLVTTYSRWTAMALEWAHRRRSELVSAITDRDGKGRRFFTPDPAKSDDDNAKARKEAREQFIATRMGRVSNFDRTLATTIARWRAERGIYVRRSGTDKPGSIRPVGSARDIKEGQTFKFDGVEWAIRVLYTNFDYHPRVLSEVGELAEDNPARHRGTAVVRVGNGPYMTEAERLSDKHEPIKLLKLQRGSYSQDVTTKDDFVLDALSNAVTLHLIYTGPAAFLDAMKEVGNFILEVVEFIPGIGTGVAVGRLVYSIVDFIAGGEFNELIATLTDDPIAQVQETITEWSERLQWDNLVMFLLFGPGSSKIRFPRKAPERKKPRDIATSVKGGRLRRLAITLKNLGFALFAALSRVRRNVQEAVFAAQLRVQSTEMLHRLVLLIADRWRALGTLTKGLLGSGFDPTKAGEALTGSVQGVLAQLGGFSIPKTILRMETVVGIVVEFIARKMGGKKGLALNAVIEGLKAIDQWKRVESAIATPLKGAEQKINAPWRSLVETHLEQPFDSGRKVLVDQFNGVFGGLDHLFGTSLRVDVPSTGVFAEPIEEEDGSIVEPDLPQMDLDKDDEVDLFNGRPVPLPSLGSGKPLPPDIQGSVESDMAAHFTDVRLHVTDDGTKFLESLGAKGATVGSHVILRKDLNLRGSGRDTLLHELGHVLQERDDGKDPASTPEAPPIRVGIRNDATLEAHADAVVRLAKRQGIDHDLRVKTRTRGLRLDTGIVPRFFRALGSDEEIRTFRGEVDDETKKTHLRDVSPSTLRSIEKVWTQLETILGGTFDATKPFSTDRKAIKDHVVGNAGVKKDVERAIELLAQRVQKPQDPRTTETDPDMWLEAKVYAAELARYIYGRTGVLLEIKPGEHEIRRKIGKKTKTLPTLDPNKPIKSVHVRFLHVGLMSAGSSLYKKIYEATFGDKMKDDSGAMVPADAAHRRAVRIQLVAYARSDEGASMFDRRAAHIRLKTSVREEILRRLEEREKGKSRPSKLPADRLPPWSEYVKPDGAPDGTHGSIGLRISAYSTKKTRTVDASQWGTERESHHLTQFLLSEYFAHGSGAKRTTSKTKWAFKHLDGTDDQELYPCVTTISSGGMPLTLEGDGKIIEVGKLADGRGGPMPAILIARSTHRSGGLHISAKGDDYGDDVSSPGGVVVAEYRLALKARHEDFWRAENDGKAALEKYMTEGDGKEPTEQSKIKTAVAGAIQHTYNWMADHMQGQLLPALLTHERTYYQTLAKAHEGKPDSPEEQERIADEAQVSSDPLRGVSRDKMARDLGVVAREAIRRNDEGLKPLGFVRR